MDLKNYFLIVLKGWWLILLAVLVAVTTALVVSYSQVPIYRTWATFVVSPTPSFEELNDFTRSLDTLANRDSIMSTYAEIATSKALLKEAREEIGLSKEQTKYLSVSSEYIHSTNILKISVESDDPAVAKAVADVVGQKAIDYVEDLYEIYRMRLLDPAYTPRTPAKPNIKDNVVLAAVLGFVVGVGLAFLLHYMRSQKESIVTASFIDSDTGSYNQYYLLQRLKEELSRAKRNGYALALVLMNIENLDSLSVMRLPRLRNEALRQVALFLKHNLREEDLVARTSGDQFALLLPHTTGIEAEKLLKKLQTQIEWTVFELKEGGLKLNLSVVSGVAAYDGANDTEREGLFRQAKIALQRAGENGNNQPYLYSHRTES